MRRLFVPGWGAPAALYAPLLTRWEVQELPCFASGGRLDTCVRHLVSRLEAAGEPAIVGGHSMGAAIAVMAATERPELVDRLVLVGPAGLPLVKPMRLSAADFVRQFRRGVYPASVAAAAAADILRAPRAAFRLARAVHGLDLTRELVELRTLGVRCQVIGCASDTLTSAAHCRRLSALVGGSYRELNLAGGHMWMLYDRRAFASVLG
jgi:pimeloyl-ACP methyl ester carboxylesterase